MKLLLTSAGITNTSIALALEKLLGKSPHDVRLAFVPTAANVESGDKHWLIDDYLHCREAGFNVDIVDISAVPQDVWLPRLEAAEVIFFGGGNTFHLMNWFIQSGLQDILPDLLKTRVYVGISAGSCVTGPTIYNSVQNLFGDTYALKINNGLGLVNFQFIPHLNSPYFDQIRKDTVEKAAKELNECVYVVDDNSAVLVNGDEVEVISEGKWFMFN